MFHCVKDILFYIILLPYSCFSIKEVVSMPGSENTKSWKTRTW